MMNVSKCLKRDVTVMKKQIISAVLAAILLAGTLAGCSAGGAGGQGGQSGTNATAEAEASGAGNGGTGAGAGEKTGGTGAGGTGAASAPKGRYVEQELSFPDGCGEVADLTSDGQGGLELYTSADGAWRRYTLRDGAWHLEENSYLEKIPVTYGVRVVYGEDGNRYAIYPEPSDYRFRLFRLPDEGEPRELLSDVLSEKRQNGHYRYFPDFLTVSREGNILLSLQDSTEVFSPEGKRLFAMPQEWSSMEWKASAYLAGDEYLTIGQSGFLKYDLSRQSGTPVEEIPYQQADTDSYAAVASDGEGGFFMVNHRGIHHMGQGGSIWETVVDGTLNSLGQPSVGINKLFTGAEDDFYVWMVSSGTHILCRYVYDPEMPSVPAQTLTVYGLDLSEAETIRQAASMFQLAHPQVRVELIDGADGGGSTTVSDTIRALNTELLTGGGADVLVLDGLPVASYIEKGVLADMSGSLKDMKESGALTDNVMRSFREADGKIYQVPARMTLLAVYGDPEALKSLSSMEGMRAYQGDPGHLPIRPRTKYESLLRQVLALRYREIVDEETKKPVPGKIRELLETVKVLGEACGAQAVFDESADGGMGAIYNMSWGTEAFRRGEYQEFDRGIISMALEKVTGMNSLMMPLAVVEKRNLTLEGADGAWIPGQILGVNQASANRELALEFIRFTLGAEVQDSDLSDGLPINRKVAEHWVDKDWGNETDMVEISGKDGYRLAGKFPDEEARRRVIDLAAAADRPILMDRVLTDIIVEETKGYFDGSLTLEQAAQNAENKANLYFSE